MKHGDHGVRLDISIMKSAAMGGGCSPLSIGRTQDAPSRVTHRLIWRLLAINRHKQIPQGFGAPHQFLEDEHDLEA